jgi:protoporphyrinogen/coproporphyrinogen III oxidase
MSGGAGAMVGGTVVVGGGLAGLVAARRLARSGPVVLVEQADRLGGRVASGPIAGVQVDTGAESFASRGGTVAALARELGLGDALVEPMPGGAWVALADRTVPLPAGGVLGIPGVPLADDVRRVVDWPGSIRAYADRLLPVLKIGRYDRLGPLVRARMGERVLTRLVAPVVESVYGADPDAVSVDAIAPGLNAAITTTGSLSSAVLQLRAAAPAGAAVQGLAGGVFRLVEALATDCTAAGVELRTATRVLGLHPAPGGWTVVTRDADLVVSRVVVATDGAGALQLLADAAPAVAALPPPEPADTRAVLLAVDAPALDARPRGSGVLRAAEVEDVRATALTHVTAKWAWVGERLPAGRHVLRLSYRGAEPVPDQVVLADASRLLGMELPAPIDRVDVRWRDSAPPLDPRTLAVRDAALGALPPGLALAGSWLHGTGLASVVAGAEGAAAGLVPR